MTSLSCESELEQTPPDVVIDALLGTGIDRPLGGRLLAAAIGESDR